MNLGKWLKDRAVGAVLAPPLLCERQTLELANEVRDSKLPDASTLKDLREIDFHSETGQERLQNDPSINCGVYILIVVSRGVLSQYYTFTCMIIYIYNVY